VRLYVACVCVSVCVLVSVCVQEEQWPFERLHPFQGHPGVSQGCTCRTVVRRRPGRCRFARFETLGETLATHIVAWGRNAWKFTQTKKNPESERVTLTSLSLARARLPVRRCLPSPRASVVEVDAASPAPRKPARRQSKIGHILSVTRSERPRIRCHGNATKRSWQWIGARLRGGAIPPTWTSNEEAL